jgi:hypothetical protein
MILKPEKALKGENQKHCMRRLIVSAFCSTKCMAASLGAIRVHGVWWRPEKADETPPPRTQPTQSIFYAVTSSCCLRVEVTTSKV